MMKRLIDIFHQYFAFDNFSEVTDYFKRLINMLKQMNYSEFRS